MTTLFERLGETRVRKLIANFYQRVLSDPILAPFFKGRDIQKIERMQFAFFSIALGADEPQDLPSLRAAHSGIGVEVKHLTRFTELLIEAIRELDIDENEIQKFYARIATYSNEILGDSNVDG